MVERKNSFHLMLSDDELSLLRLLSEQAGLNASDYLRTLMRQVVGSPQHVPHLLQLRALLGEGVDLSKRWTEVTATAAPRPKRKARKKAR